jgi:D-glycero-D-manno-heptose 1,7-bisphosphate phosphatase
MTAAVFLDRDGTIIADPGYINDPNAVRLLAGAAAGLRALQLAGFRLIVVSNQSGIGRGLITQAEADAVHERFTQELREHGVQLAGAYYCPHAPTDGCACRKPQPGMLLQASTDLGIDLRASFMIGNAATDAAAGKAVGAYTILLDIDGQGGGGANATVASWHDVPAAVGSARSAG